MLKDPRLHDILALTYRKQAQNDGSIIGNKDINISGAGCSFALDKIISALNTIQRDDCRSIDVVVCATGSRPPLKDVTQILRSLWGVGIRCGVVEANGPDEAQDLAKDLGALHVILFGDDGTLRVRSWDQNRFQERHLNRQELTEYIQRMLRPDHMSLTDASACHQSNNNQATTNVVSIKNSFLSGPALPPVEVTFLTHEKPTANLRRRYENQLKQHMTSSLILFGKKERISVIVIDLPVQFLKAVTGAIDPRNMSGKEMQDDIGIVIERFPKYKRKLLEIVEEIKDIMCESRTPVIVGLYSTTDFSYRILL